MQDNESHNNYQISELGFVSITGLNSVQPPVPLAVHEDMHRESHDKYQLSELGFVSITGLDRVQPPVPLAVHEDLHQVDELNDMVEGWNLDYLQIEPGKLDGDVLQLRHPSFMLTRGWFSRQLMGHGKSPEGYLTYGIVVGDGKSTWCGSEIDQHTLLSFGREQPYEGLRARGAVTYTLSIQKAYLERVTEVVGLAPEEQVFGDEPVALVCDPGVMMDLQRRFCRLCKTVENAPGRARSKAVIDEILVNIPATLALALATCRGRAPRVLSRERRSALERARQYLAETVPRRADMQGLCNAAGTSWRSVNYLFRDYFGVTANRYLTTLKLHGARKELQQLVGKNKVGRVARRWGYGDAVRFSADYGRQFGESPLETVRAVSRETTT